MLDLSKEWFYVILAVLIGTASAVNWALHSGDHSVAKGRKDTPAIPAKRLWTSREIPLSFPVDSWERHAFDAFRTRILLEDPQVFPCIYATKGFKANEHRFCFIENLDCNPNSTASSASLDTLAASFDEYAQNWREYGPMTSLVVLFPLSPKGEKDEASLEDDRKCFWDILRAISERDPHPWSDHIPQDVEKPAWTLTFRGERFVGLALTPRYHNRQSRFCERFVLAFQPIGLFKDLLSTPEKAARAVGTVRALTDSLDSVPYSQDVIAVGDGTKSVSTMFFLSDNDESWGSLYSQIRRG